jgi:hypothetical protein
VDRPLAMLGIGLVFGGGIGFVVAAGYGVTLDGHDHGAPRSAAAAPGAPAAHNGHGEQIAVPLGPDMPTLAATLTPDPVSGWNLRVEPTNFRFAPESAGAPHVPGEGHAHVYVDGEKIARLYGPWMHIPGLAPGATVEVTLNGNDHRPLAAHGRVLAATVRVPAE